MSKTISLARPFWVILHRYGGLAMAVFLLIAGLTGSVIAFHRELDAWLNPDWCYAQPRGERLSPGEIARRAEASLPGFWAHYLPLAAEPDRAQVVYLEERGSGLTREAEAEPKEFEVFVDPYTGAVLGAREREKFALDKRHLIPFLYRFHFTLHAGSAGEWIMGIMALVWFLDCFVGAYLTFPRGRPFFPKWMPAWKVKRGAGAYRVNFDLHRAGGLWFWLVLGAVALSGMYMNLSEPFKAMVLWFSPVTPWYTDTAPKLPQALTAPRLGFDEAIEAAQQAKPTLTPDGVWYEPAHGLYGVNLKGEEDIADYGMTEMYVDASNGTVRHVRSRTAETAGDTFLAWQFPLHSGRAFGLTGRILICVTGLVVTMLSVTGLVIWLKKRRTRQVRSAT